MKSEAEEREYITELGKLFGKTIAEANASIMDTLEYYQENFYSCGYFGVNVSSSGTINAIVLTDGGSRYTLMYIYPGMSESAARSKLSSLAFVLRTTKNNMSAYTNSQLPGFVLGVTYKSGVVSNIVLDT